MSQGAHYMRLLMHCSKVQLLQPPLATGSICLPQCDPDWLSRHTCRWIPGTLAVSKSIRWKSCLFLHFLQTVQDPPPPQNTPTTSLVTRGHRIYHQLAQNWHSLPRSWISYADFLRSANSTHVSLSLGACWPFLQQGFQDLPFAWGLCEWPATPSSQPGLGRPSAVR